jgi:hypothetical protein
MSRAGAIPSVEVGDLPMTLFFSPNTCSEEDKR